MKGRQITSTMMVIEVSHFRIAQRSIVSRRLSFGLLQFYRPVKMGVDDMYLPFRLQLRQAEIQDFLQRGEILDGSGEQDTIELLVPQYSRTDIPMHEA